MKFDAPAAANPIDRLAVVHGETPERRPVARLVLEVPASWRRNDGQHARRLPALPGDRRLHRVQQQRGRSQLLEGLRRNARRVVDAPVPDADIPAGRPLNPTTT